MHIIVHSILKRTSTSPWTVVIYTPASLRTRLKAIGSQVHILRILLNLRIGLLLVNIILMVVDFVKQLFVVNPKDLVLK